ncbi:related to SRP40 Suppressor of mutant AC40 of RNA polymerase I and III [Rhynchosporium secalis]|uniref:Related to SRP40 Suppressor of mutant AC40 of RNA polymerase I and III n=1 Tax=Rhynchosporium secalis TaxID=38038 RepID=A0A1E1M4T5_RHYSE|nr:related to SRP40 Suppressor of mutant AC40 of RNA polymerase I and III [Rhynchosporium secalis]
MPSATNIPAWRRLGLKLKSAQNSPSVDSPTTPADETSKRKRTTPEDSTPSKKLKKITKVPADSSQEPITPQLLQKKSVTFTPETKHEDGDSIKQLFNSWKTEQQAQDPTFDFASSSPAFEIPEPHKIVVEVDSNLDEKERRVKRVKPAPEKASKGKPKKPSKIVKPSAPSSRPFLQYLRQYCESKESWKFNKNHQNHLLKHAFDVESIPSDHIHFLYEYVKGLQGGVRTRLRDAAIEFKVKDKKAGEAGFPATMAQPDKRQREYEAAMDDYVATMTAATAPQELGFEEGILLGLSDGLMAGRVAKRMRTEKILAILASTPERTGSTPAKGKEDDDPKENLPNKVEAPQKVARKRKQRTVIAIEDSSSSDDTSDSDSSSDSSTAQNDQEEDSSSSSSSSSSESESEEDSDDSEDGEENGGN